MPSRVKSRRQIKISIATSVIFIVLATFVGLGLFFYWSGNFAAVITTTEPVCPVLTVADISAVTYACTGGIKTDADCWLTLEAAGLKRGAGGNWPCYCDTLSRFKSYLKNKNLPIGSWNFDEGSGTVAHDGVCNNNLLFKTTWSSDAISGKAATLSAPGGSITAPDNALLNPTSTITVSAWVKMSKSIQEQTYQNYIITKNDWPAKLGYQLAFNKPFNNNLYFRIMSKGVYADAIWDATNLKKNIWYHLAGVYDGKFIRLYLDGEAVFNEVGGVNYGITPFPGPIGTTTKSLYIGNAGANYFNGFIDEVQIFDRPLSDAEIKAIFEYTRCRRYGAAQENSKLFALSGAPHLADVKFPANLTSEQITTIANTMPWLDPDNLGICDRLYLTRQFKFSN